MPIDPKSLPQDADMLRKIVVDLIEQLDRSLAEQNKYQNLLREVWNWRMAKAWLATQMKREKRHEC